VHQIELKNEIESKYPGLYKTLSKLKSYVNNNPDVMKSVSDASGYSKSQVLKLLSLKILPILLKLVEQVNGGSFLVMLIQITYTLKLI
jgi:hypothetical protein